MKRVAVIPARLKSTRLEEKVLADICGKPMIQRVWESVSRAKLVDDVIVAVDDKKVLDLVGSFGGKAVMTSTEHASGTDRAAAAVKNIAADIVLNIQADEPLLRAEMVDELASILENEKEAKMATLIKRVENDENISDPNVVKVALDRNGCALYFSRNPIPHVRSGATAGKYFKHVGVYAYTRDFLFAFTRLAPTFLEKEERLEQLRALENGYKIKTRETKYETVSVDTLEDLERVRRIMANEI